MRSCCCTTFPLSRSSTTALPNPARAAASATVSSARSRASRSERAMSGTDVGIRFAATLYGAVVATKHHGVPSVGKRTLSSY